LTLYQLLKVPEDLQGEGQGRPYATGFFPTPHYGSVKIGAFTHQLLCGQRIADSNVQQCQGVKCNY